MTEVPDVRSSENRSAMDFRRVRNFVIRYRTSLKDISVLIAVVLVGLYLAFEYDIFKNSDGVAVHERVIELDEALLLGGTTYRSGTLLRQSKL